jgi:hypothetical protein
MPLSPRRAFCLIAVLAAGSLATAVPGPAAHDSGPRNPAGEAATGDTEAMVAVVQAIVDCLRAKGFDPGDPEVRGENVVITDWNPAWDSPAGRADRACFFAMP